MAPPSPDTCWRCWPTKARRTGMTSSDARSTRLVFRRMPGLRHLAPEGCVPKNDSEGRSALLQVWPQRASLTGPLPHHRGRPGVVHRESVRHPEFFRTNRVLGPYWPNVRKARPAVVPEEIKTGAEARIEQIEAGINRTATEVGDALLVRLRISHPALFDEAVAQLLSAMGYGRAEQRGRRIGGSSDGGIHGVIDHDALGLEQVYVQARIYAGGNSIGRKTIKAFIGALHGFGAGRGVFITTSTFT